MCAKFGCGLTVVSKKKGEKKGGYRQTDRQTDREKLQLYIVEDHSGNKYCNGKHA